MELDPLKVRLVVASFQKSVQRLTGFFLGIYLSKFDAIALLLPSLATALSWLCRGVSGGSIQIADQLERVGHFSLGIKTKTIKPEKTASKKTRHQVHKSLLTKLTATSVRVAL